MIVAGIDPDTKAVTIVTLDSEVRGSNAHKITRFEAKGRRAEDRIHALSVEIETGYMGASKFDWIYIETPIMGVNVKALRDQAFVVGMIRHELWRRGQPHSLVDNGTWKRLTVGTGHATKEEIKDWALRVEPSLPGDAKQDVYDAFCIAKYGQSAIRGEPAKGGS